MLSDIDVAEQAEALLNEMNPGAVASDDSPETPHEESDHQEVETEVEAKPAEEAKEEESAAEVLPEGHDPDATLAEDEGGKEEEEIVPQYRKDAINIAENWDTLTEEEQQQKLANLQKSGRTSTVKALAEQLGTTPKLLTNPNQAQEEKDSRIAELEKKIEEMSDVVGYASKQAANDRVVSEINKWAEHNKFSKEETDILLASDGELLTTFNSLKFNPETGEQLSHKARLRLAFKQADTVQDILASKRAKEKVAGINEGLKAAMPGAGGATNTGTSKDINTLSGEDFLAASDAALGSRTW